MTIPCFRNPARQSLAILLCGALIWTSSGAAEAIAGISAAASPVSSQVRFSPPSGIGRLTDAFTASPSNQPKKLVVLIQDLHVNYDAQKNIAGLLEFLRHRLSDEARAPQEASLPFALAVEGVEGPVDSSLIALYPDESLKLKAADFLMKEGELTGAEYFAIRRRLPNALIGVENANYYAINRDLFRRTWASRQALGKSCAGSTRTWRRCLAAFTPAPSASWSAPE